MLYISNIVSISNINSSNYGEITIINSESGESFVVIKKGTGRWTKYLFHDDAYDMNGVLGYFDKNNICEVKNYLVDFLAYVDCVEFVEPRDDAILVSKRGIKRTSSYNTLFYLQNNRYMFSILDAVFYASFDKRFMSALKSGVLVTQFHEKFLAIKFCGNHIPFILKLIMRYRDSERILEDLRGWGM